MRYDLIGQLPHHQYVQVDTAFTHRTPEVSRLPAIWFGLVSYPGRAWGCTVLLENGAVYRNLPLHALAHKMEGLSIPWKASDAQHWDCYGSGFTTVCYDTLRGLECTAKTADVEQQGEYVCTIAPVGDAYSAVPSQSKELVLVALTNGRYTLQPTDRVVFRDMSFTVGDGFPRGLRRQEETYSAEGEPSIRTQGMSRADSRRAFKDAIQGDNQWPDVQVCHSGKRPVIYLSGPITGYPDGNRPAFAAAAARLSHDGHTVINPHDLFQEDERLLRWEDYMRVDLAALLTCDQVQLLQGWSASRGAQLEKYVAEQLGMLVVEEEGAA